MSSSYPDSKTLSFSLSIPTLHWLWRSPSSCPPCRNCQPTSSFLERTTGNFLKRKRNLYVETQHKCQEIFRIEGRERPGPTSWPLLVLLTSRSYDQGDVYCVGCWSAGPPRYLKCCAGLLHDPDYSSSLTGLLYQLEIFNSISKLFLYQLKIKLNIFHCLLRASKI